MWPHHSTFPLDLPLGPHCPDPSPNLPAHLHAAPSCLFSRSKLVASVPSFHPSGSGPPLPLIKIVADPLTSLQQTASSSSSQFHKFFQLRNLQRLPTACWRKHRLLSLASEAKHWLWTLTFSQLSPSCSSHQRPSHPSRFPLKPCSAILPPPLSPLSLSLPQAQKFKPSHRPPHPHSGWKSLPSWHPHSTPPASTVAYLAYPCLCCCHWQSWSRREIRLPGDAGEFSARWGLV